MQLSIDLFNGLFLFAVKAMCVLALVHWLVEQSRDWSASAAHSLLVLAAVAVLALPLLAFYLPPVPIAVVPQAMAQWLNLPVVAQVGGKLSYNATVLAFAVSYLVVAVSFLFYMIFGITQVARISRRSHRAPDTVQQLNRTIARQLQLVRLPHVKIHHEVPSPQVWGVSRPVVLLPATYTDWPRCRLRRVLIHELAHIKRNDWLIKMLLHSLVAVMWFVPAIWFTARRIAWYAELACDDWVVLLEDARAEYANDLLTLSIDGRAAPIGAVSLVDRPDLYMRIRAILDGSRNRDPITSALCIKHGLLGLMLLFPLASVNAVVHRANHDDVADPAQQWRFVRFEPELEYVRHKSDDPNPLTRFSPEYLAPLKEVALPPTTPDDVIRVSWQGDTGTQQRLEEIDVLLDVDMEPRVVMRQTVPLATILPRYPSRALQRGIEGYVTVEFDVGIDGAVVRPRIVAAQPKGIFDEPVIDALAQFRFRPQRVNGENIITKNVTETFVFKLVNKTTTDNKSIQLSRKPDLRQPPRNE